MCSKKIFTIFSVGISILALLGCATTYDRGNGVVVSVKKIHDKDFKVHEGAKTGAVIGGVAGAISGSAAGGVAGFILGALSNVSTPVLVGTTLAGGALGAVIVGGVGVATGAGIGYVVDVGNHNAGLYQYVIKPDNDAKPITVTQYSSMIPITSRVQILEKDDAVVIKEKS